MRTLSSLRHILLPSGKKPSGKKPTNKQIVEALTLTLRYLSPTAKDADGRYEYICWALDAACQNHRIREETFEHIRRRIIHARLGECVLLDEWLLSQGVPGGALEADEGRALQAHRKAWVKLLIKEFSK